MLSTVENCTKLFLFLLLPERTAEEGTDQLWVIQPIKAAEVWRKRSAYHDVFKAICMDFPHFWNLAFVLLTNICAPNIWGE